MEQHTSVSQNVENKNSESISKTDSQINAGSNADDSKRAYQELSQENRMLRQQLDSLQQQLTDINNKLSNVQQYEPIQLEFGVKDESQIGAREKKLRADWKL